jgi:uncharacterized RDD family membrane protein YckC
MLYSWQMAERLAASRLPRREAVQTTADQPGAVSGILGARAIAYMIDTLVLMIFSVFFLGAGTLVLLLQTHGGFTDVSDSALWQFVYIWLAAIPAWLVLMLILLSRRAQTPGHFVTGLAVVRPDGTIPSPRQILIRLLALDPLLFNPVLGLSWTVAGIVSVARFTSDVVLIGCAAVALLCFIAPVIALITSTADGGHRGLHDRISGVMVVRLE